VIYLRRTIYSILKKPGGPTSGDTAIEEEEDLNFAEDAEDVLYGDPDNLQVCAFVYLTAL